MTTSDDHGDRTDLGAAADPRPDGGHPMPPSTQEPSADVAPATVSRRRRMRAAMARPKTRIGLALAGALVIGAIGGAGVSAFADGGGDHGRDGHGTHESTNTSNDSNDQGKGHDGGDR